MLICFGGQQNMLLSIWLADMDSTTCLKSNSSSQKTKTLKRLLTSNHMKARVQKKKQIKKISV